MSGTAESAAMDPGTPRAKVVVSAADGKTQISVCTGSGCVLNGSLEVLAALKRAVRSAKLSGRVTVKATGCHGLCAQGPVVVVSDGEVFYPLVTPESAKRIVTEHVAGGTAVKDLLYVEPDGRRVRRYARIGFNRKQKRIVLRNCGIVDPERIEDYIARDGYQALRKVLESMSPDDTIEFVKASGLRGRGGAGFSTGTKWSFARQSPGDEKYVVCNADEGDPGAFMDRSVLESDPHSVLEGLAIASYAIGASRAYVYVRTEYPLAVKRIRLAIDQARRRGFLGEDILGSGFALDVRVMEGAGAFVCGEETALMGSIEGKRGMPRMRPPFPAVSGLWGKPTNINNVETLATVPWIVAHGAGRYARIGTEASKGTKVFALTGKVARSGLVEVPMGTPLRDIVFDAGGGVKDGRELKAVQIGGPSGGCLPASLIDTPVEYEALGKVGAIVGSGGLVVLDERTCMVDLARYFLAFTQKESCGKCVPCRVGTKRMLEIVTRITEGNGRPGDVELLERLARDIKAASLCGLGQTAPNPVLTTLHYFRDEYYEHIEQHKCRAGECDALSFYSIDADVCRGCTVCRKHCPVGAIIGKTKEPHVIDQARCLKCGVCEEHCPFDAIRRG